MSKCKCDHPPLPPSFPRVPSLRALGDLPAQFDGGIEAHEVAVAIKPTGAVAEVEDIITRLDLGRILNARQPRITPADDGSVRRGQHVHQALGPAKIQAVVIIDRLFPGDVAGIDVTRVVGHVGVRGKPSLVDRVAEGAGPAPGRAGRPQSEPGIFVERPDVAFGAVKHIAARDRAINLRQTDGFGQIVSRRDQFIALAGHFDDQLGSPDCAAQLTAVLLEFDQFDAHHLAIGKSDLPGFAHVKIERPKQRFILRRRWVGHHPRRFRRCGHDRRSEKETDVHGLHNAISVCPRP